MKKLLFSLMAVALCSGMVGSSFAYFTDVETSTGNTFTAGTLNLKIRDGDHVWRDGVTVAEWTLSDMVPGGSETNPGTIDLMNTGTIAGHHVEVGCYYTASDGPPIGDMDTVNQNLPENWDSFAKYLEITYFMYQGDGWWIQYQKGVGYTQSTVVPPPQPTGWTADNWQISDDGDGILSLYDLKINPLDNLPPPNVGYTGLTTFEMKVRYHEDAGNDLQGDTLNLTMTFTLNQHSSQ